MEGIVVNYKDDKGYGFIRSDSSRDYIFFHITDISNSNSIDVGQEVEFDIKHTEKGLSAKNIIAGKKQKNPYIIYGLISISLVILLMIGLSYIKQIYFVFAYMIAINITTFILYGYDKYISSLDILRVPENVLHTLGILGGSISALVAQKFFRHKTQKRSFQIIYWLIVILQIIILWFIYK